MDAYVDTDLFKEIERRLLLLITEGEEGEDLLLFPPQTSSACSKVELSARFEHPAAKKLQPAAKKLQPCVVTAATRPMTGTGVFIPNLPVASTEKPRNGSKKRRNSQQRVVGNQKLLGCARSLVNQSAPAVRN